MKFIYQPEVNVSKTNDRLKSLKGLPVVAAMAMGFVMPHYGCGGPEAFEDRSDEIVGGQAVPSADTYPWMVSMSGLVCGGALIAPNWVLTAAHCEPIGSFVKVGGFPGYGAGERINVVRNIAHGDYNSSNLANDVRLLELERPVSQTPIRLNFADNFPSAVDYSQATVNDNNTTAIGWGTISSGGPLANGLMHVDLPAITNQSCQNAYPNRTIDDFSLCAGLPQGGIDACQGDSGGPLIAKDGNEDVLVGVVSWGIGCAAPGNPGVYARVSHFRDWIEQTTGLQFEPTGFLRGPMWERNANWCHGTVDGRVKIGDFNGDGQDDMMCHQGTTGYKWIDFADANGQLNGTNWQRNANWCHSTANGQLFIGDFNGDGRDDMLCHQTHTGHKWIDFADANGHFNGTDWQRAANWCVHTDQLEIGDFNGDGRDDMLCHQRSTGYKWIDFADANGHFNGTDWQRNANWCVHSASRFFVGDFNGDGRDDMLCHDTHNRWIDLADANGHFGGTDFHRGLGWCNATEHLEIGDFNGDGREDLLCHRPSDGHKWIDYAEPNGQFNGTDFTVAADWCDEPGAQILSGKFDVGPKTDLLCHGANNGYKEIAFSGL